MNLVNAILNGGRKSVTRISADRQSDRANDPIDRESHPVFAQAFVQEERLAHGRDSGCANSCGGRRGKTRARHVIHIGRAAHTQEVI